MPNTRNTPNDPGMKNFMHAASIEEPVNLVRHRINFISKLASKHDDETDELINLDGTWHPLPGKDLQGLKAYLLLTCFDMLGQGDGRSRLSHAFLYDGHAQNEDVRTNFYRFVNTMVGDQRRKELLNSVIIIKKDRLTDLPLPCIITTEDKLQMLFDIRCSYMAPESVATPGDKDKDQTGSAHQSREYIHLLWKPALFIDVIREVIGTE